MLDMLVAMLLLFVKYFAIMTGAAIKQIPNPSPGKNAMHYLTCKTLHLIKFNSFILKKLLCTEIKVLVFNIYSRLKYLV